MRCLSRSALITIAVGTMVLFGSSPALAQYDLAVTTQVVGTVTNDLYSIADHTRVTLMATTPDGSVENYLSMQLLGDNGIEIRTPPGFDPGAPFPISLSTTPMVLSGNDLSALFDPSILLFTGMTQAQYYSQGLPPGTYRLCFQSICPASICDRDVVHSPPPPAGCSNTFEIKAVEPPYLVSPPCGETITPQSLQAVTFAWTPATGAAILSGHELVPERRNGSRTTSPRFVESRIASAIMRIGLTVFEAGSKTLTWSMSRP